MRALLGLLVLTGSLSADSLHDLVRDSLRFLDPEHNKTLDYSYTLQTTKRQFDADGKLRSEESTIGSRTFQDGWPMYRVREKNGKPLSAEERKTEDARVAKRIAEFEAMPVAEREKCRRTGETWRRLEWLRELPDALIFKSAGETVVNGRKILAVDAEPNPKYRAHSMQARMLEKMKGRFLIDVADREMVRAEAEIFDSVNIGLGFLGRVDKGSRYSVDRRKLPDGNWVIVVQNIRFGARILLVKWMGNEIHTEMSDFRHRSQLTASR